MNFRVIGSFVFCELCSSTQSFLPRLILNSDGLLLNLVMFRGKIISELLNFYRSSIDE